jgi:hypothetical protein
LVRLLLLPAILQCTQLLLLLLLPALVAAMRMLLVLLLAVQMLAICCPGGLYWTILCLWKCWCSHWSTQGAADEGDFVVAQGEHNPTSWPYRIHTSLRMVAGVVPLAGHKMTVRG